MASSFTWMPFFVLICYAPPQAERDVQRNEVTAQIREREALLPPSKLQGSPRRAERDVGAKRRNPDLKEKSNDSRSQSVERVIYVSDVKFRSMVKEKIPLSDQMTPRTIFFAQQLADNASF
jgi:hypothetical protein